MVKAQEFVATVLFVLVTYAASLAPPLVSRAPIQEVAKSFLENALSSLIGTKNSPIDERRRELKQSILKACESNDLDASKKRDEIEALIAELCPLCKVDGTAASQLLQKEWLLTWTTEKEINFFIDKGISNEVTQTISGGVLENFIKFKNGGGFSVVGSLLIPDKQGVRTDFAFESATLDLDKWGSYKLPPVGKGWFDTVYLDEELRIDTNSRNDILICTPK